MSKHWNRLKRSLGRRWTEWRLPRGYQRLGTRYGGWWLDTKILGPQPLLIDCGLGEDISFPSAFLQRFSDARVIGVDPNPRSLAYCRARCPAGMEILPNALWIRGGETLTFHLPRRQDHLPQGADGVSGSLDSSHEYVAGGDCIETQTVDLDGLLARAGRAECEVLKLDIEGAEYALLDALIASGRIRAARQVLVEFHHGVTGHALADTQRIVAQLGSAGLRLMHVENRNYIFRRETRVIDQPRAILVVNVSRIGDTLLATPAIRAIAKAWPTAAVDVLGHPNRVEVLRSLPFVRRVASISKTSAPFRGWLDQLAKPYQLAFVYGFDEALVSYALRIAKHVVAFRQTDERINAQLGTRVAAPAFQSDHAARLALALPAAVGVAPAGYRLSYVVTAAEHDWAASRLAADLPADHSPLIGLQVASFPTKAYRDWPIESFIELCGRIRARWPQAHFLVFGGSQERQRTEAVKARLGPAATVYAGQLSLRQTGALMSRLDLYIGVDTGPTHLMSAFDIPLVGLYHGFSRSELIAPLEHPCFFAVDHPQAGPNCSTEASMADISVDAVFVRVCAALAAASSP